MRDPIDLSKAGVGDFVRGRSTLLEIAWLLAQSLIVDNRLNVFSFVRVGVLRLFGAQIGRNCLLRQPIQMKFPWKLEIGDNCWIGDGVVFSNHVAIRIGSNVCISQGCFLTSGSHDYAATMDLKTAEISIEDGVWLSSRCIVQMGVRIGRNAVVTPNSVVHKSLDAEGIYGGNPCKWIKPRWSSVNGAAEAADPSSN